MQKCFNRCQNCTLFCISAVFKYFSFNNTFVLPGEKNKWVLCGDTASPYMLQGSLVLPWCTSQSSVLAVVTQKELKTTAQSLDLKFPTGGADLVACINVFQGHLATVKKKKSFCCSFQIELNICSGVNYRRKISSC